MNQQGDSKPKRLEIGVGSRKSELALIQTNTIIRRLQDYYENNPDSLRLLNGGHDCSLEFNVVTMTTSGDQIQDKALIDIGTKSLFTRELEVALLDGKLDFVVHSLKDLPTTLPEGCAIGAISKRDDPDDTIVLKGSLRGQIEPLDLIFGEYSDAKKGGSSTKIGTSSQRRIAMLKRCSDRLECVDIRGNLNTRLAKLDRDDGEYSAIILAKAGLDRMGWSDRASDTLSPANDPRLIHWCYAVGQGALAVECRENDDRILDLLAPIVDLKATFETVSERNLMRKLEGGCSIPLGVRSTWTGQGLNELSLCAIVLSLDGAEIVQEHDKLELSADKNPQNEANSRSELMIRTTGIIISERILSNSVLANLIECSKLGISVANKMIDSGCLRLLRPKE